MRPLPNERSLMLSACQPAEWSHAVIQTLSDWRLVPLWRLLFHNRKPLQDIHKFCRLLSQNGVFDKNEFVTALPFNYCNLITFFLTFEVGWYAIKYVWREMWLNTMWNNISRHQCSTDTHSYSCVFLQALRELAAAWGGGVMRMPGHPRSDMWLKLVTCQLWQGAVSRGTGGLLCVHPVGRHVFTHPLCPLEYLRFGRSFSKV